MEIRLFHLNTSWDRQSIIQPKEGRKNKHVLELYVRLKRKLLQSDDLLPFLCVITLSTEYFGVWDCRHLNNVSFGFFHSLSFIFNNKIGFWSNQQIKRILAAKITFYMGC